MKYEVVQLEEKIIVGLSARTNNMSPEMGMVIGGLWEQFYGNGIYAMAKNKVSDKSLGIYTDYEGNEKNDYTVMVGCEVSEVENLQEGVIKRVFPAGKFAKFIVKGHMKKAVAEFWQQLWSMDLPRSFTWDFEEYQNADMENAEIHIYIGLKE